MVILSNLFRFLNKKTLTDYLESSCCSNLTSGKLDHGNNSLFIATTLYFLFHRVSNTMNMGKI